MSELEASVEFPFRAWVLSTCRRAIVWGIGVLALLGGIAWAFRQPGTAPLGRAFGVLVFYGALFLLSLWKIWWTAARRPAAVMTAGSLAYQQLQWFRPKSIPLDRVQWCGLREGSQSLRFVWREPSGREREFFLNLAVIERRSEFLRALGERLEALGLARVPAKFARWERPGFRDTWVGSAGA